MSRYFSGLFQWHFRAFHKPEPQYGILMHIYLYSHAGKLHCLYKASNTLTHRIRTRLARLTKPEVHQRYAIDSKSQRSTFAPLIPYFRTRAGWMKLLFASLQKNRHLYSYSSFTVQSYEAHFMEHSTKKSGCSNGLRCFFVP